MQSDWTYVLDFAFLSLFLAIATYLKRKVGFFKRFLVPNSIIAGLIGLLAGPEILGWVDISSERLGNLIYHLMAVGFISLALKDRHREKNTDVVNTGVYIVSTYLIQGLVGFVLTLLLVHTLYPDLFPAMGLLLPLGYGQGPGQAYNIGSTWEAKGFAYGGNVGLFMATMGFFWACVGGVILLNFLVKKRKMHGSEEYHGSEHHKVFEVDEPGDIPLSESIDRISIQMFLIGIVYLVTYFTIQWASMVLNNMGMFGKTLSDLLWGFNYIIGALYAMLLRVIFDFCKKKKFMVRSYPNNYLLQRIAGGSFDFMIVASIAAISISMVKHYLMPLLLVTIIGGFVTVLYTIYICKRVFKKYTLEYITALFGMLTGTISTGLALLREIDPEFKSPVAENLVLGSGVGVFVGLPLMLVLTIPIIGYTTNQPALYFYTILALLGYQVILSFFMFRKRK